MTAHLSPDRIGRITSSTAAACLGLAPRLSPIKAWSHILGQDEREPDNKDQERGRRLEDPILSWAADKLEMDLSTPGFRAHPEHGWLGASTDGILSGNGRKYAAEAKSVGMGMAKDYGEDGTDQIPTHVLIQSHVHLLCWPECSRCVVPVLIGGFDFSFRLYWVDRDEQIASSLVDRLGTWHQRHIVKGERPEATANDSDWLAKLYPTASRPAVDDPEAVNAIHAWAREYNEARLLVKVHETQQKLAKAKLQELLAEHDGASDERFSVTYRNTKDRTRVDWQAIAAAAKVPDELIQNHTRVSPGSRSLRVTIREPKEDETE